MTCVSPAEYIIPKHINTDPKTGYYRFCDSKHPMSSHGVVLLHRHMPAVKMGRWLLKGEVVHHVDGNRRNNNLDNLQVTSSSEHALLHIMDRGGKPKTEHTCMECGSTFMACQRTQRLFCSIKCCSEKTKREDTIFNVNKETLASLLWKIPSTKIAVIYGVSDVTVCKRCKEYGLTKPPRGYWARLQPDGSVSPIKPKPKPRMGWRHGTLNGYQVYKCRCDLCVLHRREHDKAYRLRIAAQKKPDA